MDSLEISERFLWDLRQTAKELVVENHARHLAELGRKHGLTLSIEPYDLNPAGDLSLGAAADVPMCEFWSKGYGFNSEFSCFEAVSIGHTMGRNIVAAESFTSGGNEAWRQYPGSMKAQADWALCCGVNRFVFHRYQHQPWLDRKPGMTFGPYGVHWDRTETWWEMVPAFHTYLARCQMMLRRGLPVADILYLAAEGAPHVFRPPGSATHGELPDRLGYNFDGCDPNTFIERASVKNGRITFPDGMSYGLLVLPQFDTMTPALLRKIESLVEDGAVVIGAPPKKSPGLENYPRCDQDVKNLAAKIWDTTRKHHPILDPEAAMTESESRNPLIGAKWIWHNEGNPAASAPVCTRYFQRTFFMETSKAIASAQAAMTADNSFELFVNGRSAGSGDNFHNIYPMEISSLLKPGTNLIVVVAENGGEQPNPAGLIGSLTIRFRDGSEMIVSTDAKWNSAIAKGGAWSTARELGPVQMSPWNLPAAIPKSQGIYPSYNFTAQTFAQIGVPPDFESDGSVRYIHRHDGDEEIYFLANRENRATSPACRFRVTGRQPELWDPLTGEHRVLPDFEQRDGVTIVPLEFAPLQSAFIVFREKVSGVGCQVSGKNFPKLRTAADISGPWEVSFDPKWGGPEKITFEKLDDWSTRSEDGIRHYSGTAVYRKTFDLEKSQIGNRKSKMFLSLGSVNVMASVKLNGRELGIVWREPWRVEIPANLLRERDNQLEITAANLWINRLVGDSALPAEKRLSWTTWNPYKKNSPLQPSGLVGPVTIREEKD